MLTHKCRVGRKGIVMGGQFQNPRGSRGPLGADPMGRSAWGPKERNVHFEVRGPVWRFSLMKWLHEQIKHINFLAKSCDQIHWTRTTNTSPDPQTKLLLVKLSFRSWHLLFFVVMYHACSRLRFHKDGLQWREIGKHNLGVFVFLVCLLYIWVFLRGLYYSKMAN